MSWRFALGVLCLVGLAASARAAVWKRMRSDGTIEFTNVAPTGHDWKKLIQGGGTQVGPSRVRATRLASSSGVVWAREHEDGTLEFTNLTPVGGKWKVLFRAGPGKASAIRGPSDVVPPRDGSHSRFSRYDDHIRDQQAFYGIPRSLLRAVIKVESDFDPHVVSSAGALGLMQLMPATAKMMGVTDVWDPRQNIMGGARYLQTLAQRFCKTPALPGPNGSSYGVVCSLEEKIKVLAGYHAGPGAVEKYGGLPPYETTRAYVTSVLRRFEEFRRRDAVSPDWAVASK